MWGRGSPCCPPSPACLGACGQTGSPQDQGEHRALLRRELQVSTLLSGVPASMRAPKHPEVPFAARAEGARGVSWPDELSILTTGPPRHARCRFPVHCSVLPRQTPLTVSPPLFQPRTRGGHSPSAGAAPGRGRPRVCRAIWAVQRQRTVAPSQAMAGRAGGSPRSLRRPPRARRPRHRTAIS